MRGEKLIYLEAIRGLAALVVVFSHFVYAYYPGIKGVDYAGAAGDSFAGLIAMTPLGVWHEGRFAVRIFFVLSGIVLSLSFFRSGDRAKAVSGAVRRYFRLAIPILACVSLAYLLHRSGLFFNDRAAALIGNHWLAGFYRFAPSALLALREGTYGAVLAYDPDLTYSSILWTMEVEFLGSMFVFAFLFLLGPSRLRFLAYALILAALVVTRRDYTVDFLLGLLLCDAMVARNRLADLSLPVGLAMVGLGLFFGGLRADWLALPGERFWDSLGAVLVIAGIVANGRLRAMLQSPVFAFLGRISFGLYLVHWLVLMSLGCGLYVLFRDKGFSHGASAFSAGSVYVAVSLVAAWFFHHAADRPAIWLGHAAFDRLRAAGRRLRATGAD